MSTIDAACAGAMILRVVGGLDLLVGSSLIHVVAFTVFAAWGRLTYQFGLAVTVVIIHLELGIVGACSDIHAEVNAPEFGAVELVAVDIDVIGLTTIRVVL